MAQYSMEMEACNDQISDFFLKKQTWLWGQDNYNTTKQQKKFTWATHRNKINSHLLMPLLSKRMTSPGGKVSHRPLYSEVK